mmetsp:Transcript_76511/g.151396  ORF Transcript_76511/g.151396 Transcript_76511/m.151396 type:complete len:162 (+) Transcript_76511:80-565(+)
MMQKSSHLVARRLLLWCCLLRAMTTEGIVLQQDADVLSALEGRAVPRETAQVDGSKDAHSLKISKRSGRVPPVILAFPTLPVSPLLQGGRKVQHGEQRSSLFAGFLRMTEPSSVMLLMLHTMAGGSAMLVVMGFAAMAVALGISSNRRPCCCCTPRVHTRL